MKIDQRTSTFHRVCLAAVVTAAWHTSAFAQTAAVPLGTADSFAVLAGSGITNTGATIIKGDVGSFPTTSQTGFGTVTLNGANHGGDSVTQQAKIDLVTAYNNAAGRPANVVYAPASELGGLNLVSGVYKNPTSFGLTGALTLNAAGNPGAVWIFQAGSTLITASNSSVILINGGQACHVFWQLGSSATLGTGTSFQGNILASDSITANTGASVIGRLLALNGAVTLDTDTIALAICQAVVTAPPQKKKVSGPSVAVQKKALIQAAQLANVKALIQSAQLANVITTQELTSIYTLGFAQFDSEVFSLQQRFADIRVNSGQPEALNVPNSIPSEKNPWSGKNPRGGKNAWSGKNAWGGKNGAGGEGVQPKQVQVDDDDRFGFFITGTGEFATSGDADGKSVGATLGMDCRLSDHFLLGVSIGYSRSESSFPDDTRVKSDGGKVALYAMYQHGGFYTEGLIGAGYNTYDITRRAFLGDAHGSPSGVQFDSYLGMGYDLKHGALTVTPMASLLYTQVGIEGYNEHGSLVPLNIDSQHASSLRGRLGPRVAYTTHVGKVRVTPSFSAEWQHEFLDDELPFDARFSNEPNHLFTVHGPKIGRDSVLLTSALNVAWRRYAIYVAYQANLGRKNYEDQSVLGGFRVSW